MNSKKMDKKIPYEPPRIYELKVDMTQAMGQTMCNPTGDGASGACFPQGNQPGGTGAFCSTGESANISCGSTGNNAGGFCNPTGNAVGGM